MMWVYLGYYLERSHQVGQHVQVFNNHRHLNG